MRDAIQLTTEQLIEIREKVRRKINPVDPIIALPEFDLQYIETRQGGTSYIIQYSWCKDEYAETESALEVKLKLSYEEKEVFKIIVGFNRRPEDERYEMVCGVEHGYKLDEYWQKQLSKRPEGSDFDNWQAIAYDFLVINSYIAYYNTDEVFDIEEKVAKMPSKKISKKKSGNNNKVRLYKVYTLKKSWRTAKRLKTPHKIECGAWGVRGHFRHYRNGSIVFIKAYVKGKDKENYKGKEYKLVGANNDKK